MDGRQGLSEILGGSSMATSLVDDLRICFFFRNNTRMAAENKENRISLSLCLAFYGSLPCWCSYLRVRYEDIASSAESAVKHMYEWSGLGPVPPRVALWLNENTRLPECDERGKFFSQHTNMVTYMHAHENARLRMSVRRHGLHSCSQRNVALNLRRGNARHTERNQTNQYSSLY